MKHLNLFVLTTMLLMCLPPGGDKALKEFIQKNLRYPTEAMKKGIQGRVIVTFNVETDGSITDAKVVKAVDSLLNNEALRIVKSMPKWQPGGMMSKGKTVLTKYKYTIPVIFKLEEKKQSVTGTGF